MEASVWDLPEIHLELVFKVERQLLDFFLHCFTSAEAKVGVRRVVAVVKVRTLCVALERRERREEGGEGV